MKAPPAPWPVRGAVGAVPLSRFGTAVGLRARPAVVVLQPIDGATSGTAWFLEGNHLVTNAHVLDELSREAIKARTIDGRTADGIATCRRPTPDLAVMRTELDPLATLQPGDSTDLTAGQPLVQIGPVRLGYWTVSIARFDGGLCHLSAGPGRARRSPGHRHRRAVPRALNGHYRSVGPTGLRRAEPCSDGLRTTDRAPGLTPPDTPRLPAFAGPGRRPGSGTAGRCRRARRTGSPARRPPACRRPPRRTAGWPPRPARRRPPRW